MLTTVHFADDSPKCLVRQDLYIDDLDNVKFEDIILYSRIAHTKNYPESTAK
jgi:hypothetical protein